MVEAGGSAWPGSLWPFCLECKPGNRARQLTQAGFSSLMLYRRQGMLFRRILIVLAVGAILMGLASTTFVWAAPGQSPASQTIPSRTPVAPPTKEAKDTPAPTPTPWTGTAMPVVTVMTLPLPQTLPASGSAHPFPAGWMAAGILLTLTGWFARCRVG